MANEITPLRRSTEVQSAADADNLPSKMEQAMVFVKDAVANMKPDDIAIEITSQRDGHRASARFSFRAYKRNQRIVDEERDV